MKAQHATFLRLDLSKFSLNFVVEFLEFLPRSQLFWAPIIERTITRDTTVNIQGEPISHVLN